MFLDLLFPNRCLHCNRIIDGKIFICNLCFEHLEFYHFNESKHNLLLERCKLLFPIENAFALLEFKKEGLSRETVHAIKYKGRQNIGKSLAEWTSEKIDLKKIKPDLVLSVPLHPRKKKERGYNQLHLFTETLAKINEIPFDHDLIVRNIYKKSQTFKNRERRSEGKNLFSLTKEINNKHILLIDDVFTTGSTMSHFAWEILKNPTNKVSVLVIAFDV